MRQAVEAGVNHIDTAHFYGSVNALIRAALAPYPDDLVLVSKMGAVRDADGRLIPAQRPEQLRDQVEANLATLGVEQVAVVNLRRLDARPGLIAEGDQQVGLDDQLAEMSALREACGCPRRPPRRWISWPSPSDPHLTAGPDGAQEGER